jgi:23S rRNA U2552 (ribose-2'-O)-methylase RlmE/FtsJ
MIEILSVLDFFKRHPLNKPHQSAHVCEGPGGFIEALVNIRKCPNDKYIGMTILEDINDKNIPGWKKSNHFLKNNKNVFIENGEDKTGNILSLDNFVYCSKKYSSTMDIITADGGFDFSVDFNNQEINIVKLLFAQISFALTMQKKEGIFILKIFDCFMQHSIDLLYILSSFYEKVYIFKPNTSRSANSEKFIICKNFLFSNSDDFFPYLYKSFSKIVEQPDFTVQFVNSGELYVHRFLNTQIPYLFINKLEDYNAIFGEKQIDNIQYTLLLIDNKNKQDKIDNLININIQKCINWCMKYDIEYNSFS